jgi:hypothetical protein
MYLFIYVFMISIYLFMKHLCIYDVYLYMYEHLCVYVFIWYVFMYLFI